MTFVRFVRYENANAMRPLNICERRVVFARNVSMDGKEWLSSLDREIICEKRELLFLQNQLQYFLPPKMAPNSQNSNPGGVR